jgi:mono/diheme cytochrome c family protein
MSQEPNNPSRETLDDSAPRSGESAAPVYLIGLLALLVYFGMLYLERFGGGFSDKVYSPYSSYAEVDEHQPPHFIDPKVLGARIFSANCSPCHQMTGLGLPGQFPPLVGSDWVNFKSPDRVIRIVLNGLSGPIKVKGLDFNNVMVPWKATLKDEDIAAVLTFVRDNAEWSNQASDVTPAQVKAIREKIKDRDGAFSPAELLKIP